MSRSSQTTHMIKNSIFIFIFKSKHCHLVDCCINTSQSQQQKQKLTTFNKTISQTPLSRHTTNYLLCCQKNKKQQTTTAAVLCPSIHPLLFTNNKKKTSAAPMEFFGVFLRRAACDNNNGTKWGQRNGHTKKQTRAPLRSLINTAPSRTSYRTVSSHCWLAKLSLCCCVVWSAEQQTVGQARRAGAMARQSGSNYLDDCTRGISDVAMSREGPKKSGGDNGIVSCGTERSTHEERKDCRGRTVKTNLHLFSSLIAYQKFLVPTKL